MTTIAVVHASQLVTLAGPARPRVGPEMLEVGLVRDGAMVVREGKIEWVGATDEMPAFDGETLDASGCVVAPGFVDAHTHPIFGGSRANEFEMRCQGASYEEIASAGGGIQSTVAKTRSLTLDQMLDAGVRHVQWMIAGGTTTIEAKSGYGLTVESEVNILRAIALLFDRTGITAVPTFLGAHTVPSEFVGRKEAYIACVIKEMLPKIMKHGLAEFCDVFCEPGYFTPEDVRLIAEAAKSCGLRLRLHADQLTLSGGASLAGELGAITADHLEQTDSIGISAMRSAGVMPVLLPGSVYALGKTKYADARGMIQGELPVILATDFNPGSSPTPSIPMVMSLACTQMKMTPAECMTAVTVNAAYSLGRGNSIGSLEVGKRADFAVHACSDYRELAQFFGFNRAKAVFAGGRRIHSI